MKLRDELLEFIHDRWTRVTTRIWVAIVVLILIYSIITGRWDILWVSVYALIVIFLISNSLFILLAKEKLPAIEAAGKRSRAQSVSKFSLLLPYASVALIAAAFLVPVFGFVPPFSQPVDVFLNGTPTLIPTITLTPTLTPLPTLPPTSTATITPSATVTPKVQGVYYMIVLDASAGMDGAFDGSTKWDAALDTVSAIIDGLAPGASYGLVAVGGAPAAEDVDACNEPSSVKTIFSSQKVVNDQLPRLRPVGGGSYDIAYALAQNQFEGLPKNTIHVLLYVTGSSDSCKSRDEWQSLERLFKTKDDASVELHSEIIILDQDSSFDVQALAARLTGLSTNVNVQAPQNLAQLQQSENTVITHVTNYIANQVIALITDTPTATSTVTLTLPPGTPTATPSITMTSSITPTLAPPTAVLTWTPTITPVTPSSTAGSPASVELLTVTYLTQGTGCQIDVQVRVTGGPATGIFHVRNDSYTPGDSSVSPQTTLQLGTNWASSFAYSNQITLSGDQPAYYNHEVWFEYNSVQSNHLKDLVCPGIPPPPN